MKKLILGTCILLLLLSTRSYAQTTLALGDIAFTGYNSDGNDEFSFIILRTGGIASGTVIKFTNFGWATGACGTNGWGAIAEQEVVWTSNAAVNYGTHIRIRGLTASPAGTATGTALVLSGLGDQIFAYQGTRTGAYTMLAGIHMNENVGVTSATNWDNVGAPNNTESNRPTCIVNGTHGLFINPEVDNARLRESVILSGNPATDRSRVNNAANWEVNDVTPFVLPGSIDRTTAVGVGALESNLTGDENTAVGFEAMMSNTSGNRNSSFGIRALANNLSGSGNTAIGDSAGYSSLGSGNVFIGRKAGANETGNDKLYIGNDANRTILYGNLSTGQILLGRPDPNGFVFSGNRTLNVLGGVLADSVRIALSTGWADHVFEKGYQLRSLEALEEYISKNKRLPGIPSANEVAINGINLAEMNARLLEKIEELTLYVMELKKEIDELKIKTQKREANKNN